MGRADTTPRLAWCADPHLETVPYRLAVKLGHGQAVAEPDSHLSAHMSPGLPFAIR
jgi:hypothetical protein